MTNEKEFDLEKRTTEFAKKVIRLCKKLPVNPINNRLTGQEVGSAGSIGANYREANDALGKKDLIQRLKISRREAKEAIHWLELIKEANPEFSIEIDDLLKENLEIKNILSAIINKFHDLRTLSVVILNDSEGSLDSSAEFILRFFALLRMTIEGLQNDYVSRKM